MNIGNKIKELRKQRGITQEQLAESIGVSFQAVSKWENNIALPDITLAPVLANYFGVSMDVLFDFNVKDIEEKALAIAKESWKYRKSDWAKAREIIDDGLKEYPDNDILLLNRLYVMSSEEDPDGVIEIASKIIDVSKDEATKYDACRFMAYAYKAKNDLESARKTINLIPDIRFSNQRLKASVLEGEEKWDAACQEYAEALYALMFIMYKCAECYQEKGEHTEALKECERALSVLDILEVKEGWYGWRKAFKENIANIKAKTE
ncbi:MAG: helix-turn-helix domain-containing protein [Clostridia bacterium]|nr:helix-turn-helix domain-containing protein [Clostridia bacterium]